MPDGFTNLQVLPPFLYPPFVLPFVAPFTFLPELAVRVAWFGLTLGLAVLVYGHFLWREKTLAGPLRAMSLVLVALIGLQVYLGAQTIWTGRSIVMTTGHVVTGALTLATVFLVVFLTRRASMEPSHP